MKKVILISFALISLAACKKNKELVCTRSIDGEVVSEFTIKAEDKDLNETDFHIGGQHILTVCE